MFRRDLFSALGRRSTIDIGHSKTPEPPTRDSDLIDGEAQRIDQPESINPNDIIFEPYISSSSSSMSDNENLSEEIVSIDIDNLDELDLEVERTIQTSPPVTPQCPEVTIEKYEGIEHFAVLKQTVFFGSIFSDEERDYILSHMEQVQYPPDSLLFSQGDVPSYLFIIVEGTAELIQTDVKGKSNSLQKLFIGSVIGETDIYNHNRCEYYCVTCENVVALRLCSAELLSIIKKNKRYELYLRRSLCSRNWKQMMWINQILQGKDGHSQEDVFEIDQGPTRHLRKNSVQFTTDMFVNEDKDLNVCINQYKLIKEVSVGINSRIYVGLSERDNQYYALKSINKHMKSIKSNSKLYRFWGNNAIDSLRTEANILKDLNHPNIVQLEEVIVDNKMNDFILIEELIRGHIIMEEFSTPQTPIPMTKAIQIFRGILKGVHYLHSKGIIHGDLKISNVMIENSWEELPTDIDINSLTESNDLSASRTSTPPNGDVFTPSESPWSPKPSPVPAGENQDSKRVTFADQGPSKRFDGVDKNCEHFYRQKKAAILERNENRVRIIDFGVSYNSYKGDSSIYGTPMSMPPEVYNSSIIKSTQQAVKKKFGKQVSSAIVNAAFNFGMARDIWSLGVLLFTMVTGVPPFSGDNLKKLSEMIMFKEPDYNNKYINHEYALKDLLRRMLEKNPLKRISLNEIITHEWVTMDGYYPLKGYDQGVTMEGPPLLAISPTNKKNSLDKEKNTSQRLQAILNTKKATKSNTDCLPRSNSSLDLHLMDMESLTPDPHSIYVSQQSIPSSETLTQSPPTLFPSDSSHCYHRKGNSTLSHDCQYYLDSTPCLTPEVVSPSPVNPPVAYECHDDPLKFRPRNASVDFTSSTFSPLPLTISKVLSRSASPAPPTEHNSQNPPPLPTRDYEYDSSMVSQSPRCSMFRRVDVNDLPGPYRDRESTSPHVLIGRGAVSTNYQSIHLARPPSKSEAFLEIPDRYVKKLNTMRVSGSIPPVLQTEGNPVTTIQKERSDTISSYSSSRESEDDFEKELKTYEIISSPAFLDKHLIQSPDSDESDYGEIAESSHIFDDLDTPTVSPVALDSALAREFEPLEKGVTPVRTVHGNMVCSEMRIVCAFDSDKNGRQSMEDRISLLLSTKGIVPEGNHRMNASIFCLFDGHGGNDCVDFINNRFISTLIGQPSFSEDIVTAVVNTYATLDKSFLEVAEENNFYSGCTSSTVILINTKYEKTIYCANCGDSRAVLCRNGTSIELNVCHNTSNPTEVARIMEAGGTIYNDRIMGIMQVTRSLGDIEYKTKKEYYWKTEFKDNLITSIPDICKEYRMQDDEFIIMASDGVFDVIPPQACVNFVRRQLIINNDLDLCSQELLKRAKRLGSPDNISVIIIYLNSAKPAM